MHIRTCTCTHAGTRMHTMRTQADAMQCAHSHFNSTSTEIEAASEMSAPAHDIASAPPAAEGNGHLWRAVEETDQLSHRSDDSGGFGGASDGADSDLEILMASLSALDCEAFPGLNEGLSRAPLIARRNIVGAEPPESLAAAPALARMAESAPVPGAAASTAGHLFRQLLRPQATAFVDPRESASFRPTVFDNSGCVEHTTHCGLRCRELIFHGRHQIVQCRNLCMAIPEERGTNHHQGPHNCGGPHDMPDLVPDPWADQ